MRRKLWFLSWLCCLCFSGSLSAASAEGKLTEGLENPGYHEQPKWFKLSLLDLRDDLKESIVAKKRLVVYFYQDGCPYCKKLLEENFGQRDIAEKTQKHFDVISINIWGSKEVKDLAGQTMDEKQFAASLKVQFTPTLLFFDEKGEVALRINGYYYPDKFRVALDYVANKLEKTESFAVYYKKNSAKTPKAKLNFEPTFAKPPYDFKKLLSTQKKPLLVLFEQPGCRLCDELHKDILSLDKIKIEMKKLTVAAVDLWSKETVVTPLGQKTTVEKWAKELGVTSTPSLVFFDAKGKEVFRTEAFFKSFHIQGAMAYVHEEAYVSQPNFQRYLQAWRDKLAQQGIKVNIME